MQTKCISLGKYVGHTYVIALAFKTMDSTD